MVSLLLLLGLALAQPSFRDNFDGSTFDRSSWNVEVNCNGGGNQEAQCYVDDPANIFVSDGALNIVARRDANGDITSGRLNTLGKVERTYGRWEARVQVHLSQDVSQWRTTPGLDRSYRRVSRRPTGEKASVSWKWGEQ